MKLEGFVPCCLVIIIIIESSRGSFAQPSYIQTQHRIYLLIGQELVFEHEYAGECAICGRGQNFSRASARCCLTFPTGVYSAPRLSSWSFSSLTRCTGFADSPRLANSKLRLHGKLPTPFDFTSWLVCPECSPLPCARYEFHWTLQYFCILQGQLLFVLWQLFWIHHVSCRVGNSAMVFITEPTTSTQARTRFSCMGVGTLNQSISQDGSCWLVLVSILTSKIAARIILFFHWKWSRRKVFLAHFIQLLSNFSSPWQNRKRKGQK